MSASPTSAPPVTARPRTFLPLRAILCAAALGLVLGASSEARGDELAELEKARAAYLARNYVDAEARFRRLLDPEKSLVKDPAVLAQARMVWGAVLFARGKRDDAQAVFEQLLLAEPSFEPDPLTFPSDVLDLFFDVRTKIRDRLNAAAEASARREAERRAREETERRRAAERVRLLERLAAEEKTTVRSSRWVASVPFGVGQMQNGDHALGWSLFGVEAALLVGSLVTVPLYVNARTRALEEVARRDPDRVADQYNARAATARLVNLSLVGALAGVGLLGVAQAHFAFVPERVEVKKRPLPETTARPRFVPELGPSPDGRGASVGATVTF